MPAAVVTVLGGLPVWAEVSFYRGDGWTTDDDAQVDGLYWLRRDGSKGAPLSSKMLDRLEKRDHFWECGVIEQVTDSLIHDDIQSVVDKPATGLQCQLVSDSLTELAR